VSHPPITIVRGYPGGMGHEVERLVAAGAACAVVAWPAPPPDSDDALPEPAAEVLCRALLAIGRLAFRWDAMPESLDKARFFPAPRRSPLECLASWIMPSDDAVLFGVMTTGDPAVASRLFTYGGWTAAVQAVLAYDPGADSGPIVAALQRGLDWRGRRLPAGARLLFGPGHDGAFGLVAAADAATLDRFAALLKIGAVAS
jgi:hypothetical protein